MHYSCHLCIQPLNPQRCTIHTDSILLLQLVTRKLFQHLSGNVNSKEFQRLSLFSCRANMKNRQYSIQRKPLFFHCIVLSRSPSSNCKTDTSAHILPHKISSFQHYQPRSASSIVFVGFCFSLSLAYVDTKTLITGLQYPTIRNDTFLRCSLSLTAGIQQ